MSDLTWFNQDEYDMPGDFSPIPEGKYLAALIGSVEKDNKKGTGKLLELKFQVIDGEHKGRNLWDRLNIINKSADAQKIARSQLKSLCLAVNVPAPKNSADLENIPLILQVSVSKRADTGALQNEIKGYFQKGEAQTTEQAAASPGGGGGDVAPWEK